MQCGLHASRAQPAPLRVGCHAREHERLGRHLRAQLRHGVAPWPWQRRHAAPAPARSSQQGAANAEAEAPQPSYQWHTGLGEGADLAQAVQAAAAAALAGWPAAAPPPDLAIAFVSSFYHAEYERLVPLLLERVPTLRHVLGSSGFGVIGWRGGQAEEAEMAPAVGLALAALPGVELRALHVPPEGLPDADAPPDAWRSLLGVAPPTSPGAAAPSAAARVRQSFIVVADPTFGGVMDLLAGLDFAFPEASKVGGLSSGATASHRRATWAFSLADASSAQQGPHATGASLLALAGPLALEPLVAQGCRPLGEGLLSVRSAHGNLVLTVATDAGKEVSPLDALREDLGRLPPDQRQAAASNLVVGLVPDGFKPAAELGPGDFLVRALMGADADSGAVAVGEGVRVGQRMRFMVRDREGARSDLVEHCLQLKRASLAASLAGAPQAPALGALLFTCNGRGRGLYGEPHFDSRTLGEYVPAPAAGFFCNGEIGQVGGGATYLHGFTCSAAILRAVPAGGAAAAEGQVQQQQEGEGG